MSNDTNIVGARSYGKGNKRILKAEDLAHAWLIVNFLEQHGKVSFGSSTLRYYGQMLKYPMHEHKGKAIIKVFKKAGLIERVSGHIPGQKCTTYQIKG